WLKVQMQGNLKASGGRQLGELGFSFEGEKSAAFNDYRKCQRADLIKDVVVRTLASPRLALSMGDIGNLTSGDAVSFQMRGKLQAQVTVTWSDIFSSQIGLLSKIAGGATIGFKIETGLNVSAKIEVIDDFLLVFTRSAIDSYRVAVKKANSRSADVSAKLGVT